MKNSVLVLYLLLSTSFIHPPQKMQEIVSTSAATENEAVSPEHLVRGEVVTVAAGILLTVKLQVKLVPTQPAAVGVTVYVTDPPPGKVVVTLWAITDPLPGP